MEETLSSILYIITDEKLESLPQAPQHQPTMLFMKQLLPCYLKTKAHLMRLGIDVTLLAGSASLPSSYLNTDMPILTQVQVIIKIPKHLLPMTPVMKFNATWWVYLLRFPSVFVAVSANRHVMNCNKLSVVLFWWTETMLNVGKIIIHRYIWQSLSLFKFLTN